MREQIESAKLYRAINTQEFDELLANNGGTLEGFLSRDGEVDFTMHEGTKWDSNSKGWPLLLLGATTFNGKRPLILEVEEKITGRSTTENMTATSNWINTDTPFQAHANVTRTVRARIFAMDIELLQEMIRHVRQQVAM